MEPKKKKSYEKPKITKIKLDAACVVLAGFCKTSGSFGPGAPGCGTGVPCSSHGS